MTQALVLRTDDEVFTLAERISKVSIVPASYRNKPGDIAVAILYGQELGLAPMTSLNRIVVVEGKPTLDAQGMVAVVRQAGHSIMGSADANGATAIGRRGDNGDEMTVTFTMDDAKRAGLAGKQVWQKYPASMCWARSVSQLGRELFADCLLGFSYTAEEADFDGSTPYSGEAAPVPPVPVAEAPATTRVAAPKPVTATAPEPAEDDIAEGEIVPDNEPSTGGEDEAGRDPAGSLGEDPQRPFEAEGATPAPKEDDSAAASPSSSTEEPASSASDEPPIALSGEMVTQPQVNKLRKRLKQDGITADEAVLEHVAGLVLRPIEKLKDLTIEDFEKLAIILEMN